jgi:hypothetical protein
MRLFLGRVGREGGGWLIMRKRKHLPPSEKGVRGKSLEVGVIMLNGNYIQQKKLLSLSRTPHITLLWVLFPIMSKGYKFTL